MITDAGIKSALLRAPKTKKAIQLKDGGERGAGRLVLVVKPFDSRVSAEWYACSYRGGGRKSVKIGSFPGMSLKSARQAFRERYAPEISAGKPVMGLRAKAAKNRDATFGALVDSYLEHLEGKASHRAAGYALAAAVEHFGGARLAAGITTPELSEYLGEIHARGSIVAADSARSYLHAAFERAIKGENDYTRRASVKSWGIAFNPISNIPLDHEARRVGTRNLSPAEWATLFRWLETKDESWVVAPAIRLNMLTGQRLIEIGLLRRPQYDRDESMLNWAKTKNKMPHSLPLPRQAAAILDELAPDSDGRFFPKQRGANEGVSYAAMSKLLGEFMEEHPRIKHFTARDIRRTWKTLTGAAGISKEMRDRLQNHAQTDVGSKHYDRYAYITEKREAMAKWSAYVDRMLAK